METSTYPHTYPKTRRFLIMEGGPFYRIERRVGLIRENPPRTIRSAVLAACLTWLVLLILSALNGAAAGEGVELPFLHDFSAYGRFLLAIPLLLMAERVLGPRIADTAERFLLANIVTQTDFNRFDAAIERGLLRRDSVVAELIIALLAYALSVVAFRSLTVPSTTWYAAPVDGGGITITWAGWWLILFCVPLLQFLILRWLWRMFLWFCLLSEVSKLDLQLFPTHPDQAGGLGFVGGAQRCFGMLFFAYSCGITGIIADEIIYGRLPLKHFAPAIAAYAVLALLLTAAPLVVFAKRLLITKREGLHRYGALATAYTGRFQHKWIEAGNAEHEELLGTGDIQSLADLGNSYEFIKRMKPIPVAPRALIHLVVLALLPMFSLLLTVMPVKEVVKLLLKVLV